jgi:hypothetical protein
MSALLAQGRLGQSITSADLIDMHGHIGRYGYLIPDLSVAGLVAVMDRIGVKQIVVSHMQCASADMARANQEVREATQAFPGRILGYASLWPESEQAVREEVERRLAEGFTGIKIHNSNGFSYNESAYTPAYEIAEERRLPVLLHTWGGAEEFAQVAVLAARYDQISFLLAHSGSRNASEYVRLAREHPNIYLDICFSAAPRGMVARLVTEAGVDKVVWGSDAYFYSQAQQVGKVLAADLSEEAKAQVLGGNAKRILARAGTGGPA